MFSTDYCWTVAWVVAIALALLRLCIACTQKEGGELGCVSARIIIVGMCFILICFIFHHAGLFIFFDFEKLPAIANAVLSYVFNTYTFIFVFGILSIGILSLEDVICKLYNGDN